jgi:hypothetical protein
MMISEVDVSKLVPVLTLLLMTKVPVRLAVVNAESRLRVAPVILLENTHELSMDVSDWIVIVLAPESICPEVMNTPARPSSFVKISSLIRIVPGIKREYTDPLYTSGKYVTPDVYNVLPHSCEYRAEYGILLLELIKV